MSSWGQLQNYWPALVLAVCADGTPRIRCKVAWGVDNLWCGVSDKMSIKLNVNQNPSQLSGSSFSKFPLRIIPPLCLLLIQSWKPVIADGFLSGLSYLISLPQKISVSNALQMSCISAWPVRSNLVLDSNHTKSASTLLKRKTSGHETAQSSVLCVPSCLHRGRVNTQRNIDQFPNSDTTEFVF